MDLKLTSSAQGLSFAVKVLPRASRNSVAGIEEEFLKIRLMAPPVDGKANQALIKFLSKWLAVPQSSVHIQAGLLSRRKVVLVENYDVARFCKLLSSLNL
jgi:uncharacterized protein (TIGR00251 family)